MSRLNSGLVAAADLSLQIIKKLAEVLKDRGAEADDVRFLLDGPEWVCQGIADLILNNFVILRGGYTPNQVPVDLAPIVNRLKTHSHLELLAQIDCLGVFESLRAVYEFVEVRREIQLEHLFSLIYKGRCRPALPQELVAIIPHIQRQETVVPAELETATYYSGRGHGYRGVCYRRRYRKGTEERSSLGFLDSEELFTWTEVPVVPPSTKTHKHIVVIPDLSQGGFG
ncbi:MAG: hypothetical protein V4481_03520 [Patescibacteria group bacterium]